ncbi:MAG: SWIM zinc finger family protein [Anaerolineaceae bacterium]|jgi:hypothetical protein
MDSGLIGKIEKARRYSEEHDRIQFSNFTAQFKGDNNDHTVTYDDGKWTCTCNYFQARGICAHTMGLELILKDMVQPHEDTTF